MTLTKIGDWLNRALKNRIHPDQFPDIIDTVHKLAVAEGHAAFKEWNTNLTICQQLNYTSAATPPDADDIDQTATGQVSGVTGTVKYYNNTSKHIAVETSGNFTAGEQITTPEGLDITLESTTHQEGYKGPYDYPVSPPVRKMIGITTVKDTSIFGTEAVYISDLDDYGLILDNYNEAKFFKPARLDDLAKTLKLQTTPNTSDVYRWIYFRGAEDISDLANDDRKFLVPPEYHMHFVKGCIEVANIVLDKKKKFDPNFAEKLFGVWWQQLKKPYTPMGKNTNRKSQASSNSRMWV